MSPMSPFLILSMVSRYSFCERRCAPDFTVSFSSSDFLAAAMKRRTLTGSVPIGFSQKMCFLALTAASKCMRAIARMGRQHHDVDVARDQLLVGIEADEAVLGVHLDAL